MALLVLVSGAVAMIVAAVTGAVDARPETYVFLGGAIVVFTAAFVGILRRLRAGAPPLPRSGPEHAAAVRRARRLQIFSLVCAFVAAAVSLGHPLWDEDVDWFRIVQGVFCALLGAFLAWFVHRTRGAGSSDAT
ncbi:hypothetical protein [Asanoa siamensis]|uniref:hypothetical protein n=1 Tax=Asanoa siamensis TaxID=926357 RepID=UPI001942E8CB|nr:hypothetical protein [Asanoa siamensis]